MQQKNGVLADALAQAKDELRTSERDRASLEEEKRRIQTQLTNSQRQIVTAEASLEAANQVS
jgi:chromosome segregation ATPase